MSLVELLRRHHDAFLQRYQAKLTPAIRQAMEAMLRCRVDSERCSHWGCQGCAQQAEFPLSCGHRSCPQCQHNTTQDWLHRQEQKLLPVDYFMVTFTVPFELRTLAQAQPEAVYQAMFTVAADTLRSFAARSAQLGGEIGLTGVLHTHSRRRDYHPHIHFMIPAGSLVANQQWRKLRGDYLFNAFNLAKVWRARLLAELDRRLGIQAPSILPRKWVVDCRRVGRGLPALQYLSRYLYRGVLPDQQIVSVHDGQVTFRYQDSRSGEEKLRTLAAVEFLWLILQHVLPKGLRRVRDYGLLSGGCRQRLRQIQLMLAVAGSVLPPPLKPKRTVAVRACPSCHQPMQFLGVRRRKRPATVTA
ncbi:IS91 family transposase [Ferrimonas pelagia]|uniref:IS91 family transposase n=1 Tax=Ferrimonas pelagia TaxID=1177826 RepID=A0ABP9EM66_9GAMM